MNNRTSTKASMLPVWLWFWLGVYIVSLPALVGYSIYLFQDSFSQSYTWMVEAGAENPFFELLRATNLYEIAAYIVVLVGVVSIFFPRIRARIVEQKYKLVARDENSTIREISAFVQQYVPHIQVKANLLRTDLFAITYPMGFREPVLGVFGKLVILWRSDQKTAEAILQHEIAHIRQGDTLVLGAGSLFETTVSYWVWVFLLFIFLPVTLYTGKSILDIGPQLSQFGFLTQGNYISQAFPVLANGILSLFGEFLTTFSVFILPLAGIWTSELLADKLAAAEVNSNETMQKALLLLAEEKEWKWKEKILAGATHPTTALRSYLVERAQSGRVILLLTIFFPLMYVAKLLVNLGSFLPSLSTGWDDFAHDVSLFTNLWAGSALPTFIVMIAWLLLWDRLEPWWDKIFLRAETRRDRSHARVSALSAIVPMVLALCAGALALVPVYPRHSGQATTALVQVATNPGTATLSTPIPTRQDNQYKIGQIFQAGDAQVVVLGWETLTDSPDLQGTKNKEIVRVEVAVRNNGNDTIAPLISSALLKDASGKEYHYSMDDAENSVIIDYDLPSDAPQPGQKILGKITFLVDQSATNLQFIYVANPPLDMTRAFAALTNDPANRITPPETLPESSHPPAASLGQALTLKNITVMVTKTRKFDSKIVTPASGNKLIALDLTINNTGSEPFKISNILLFELEDEDGITYRPNPLATVAFGNPKEDLLPGKQVNLSIGYEVPENLQKAQIQYVLESDKMIGLEIP